MTIALSHAGLSNPMELTILGSWIHLIFSQQFVVYTINSVKLCIVKYAELISNWKRLNNSEELFINELVQEKAME